MSNIGDEPSTIEETVIADWESNNETVERAEVVELDENEFAEINEHLSSIERAGLLLLIVFLLIQPLYINSNSFFIMAKRYVCSARCRSPSYNSFNPQIIQNLFPLRIQADFPEILYDEKPVSN
ncbi:unnamed protein product [Rhizopus stolonifer]